jgi:hypothetical protein
MPLYLRQVEIGGAFLGGSDADWSPGILAYAAVGALYGAGIGMGIGFFIKRDRWDPVSLQNEMASGLFGGARRVQLGVSVRMDRRD